MNGTGVSNVFHSSQSQCSESLVSIPLECVNPNLGNFPACAPVGRIIVDDIRRLSRPKSPRSLQQFSCIATHLHIDDVCQPSMTILF